MQISSVLRAAQHREIMSTTKQHSLEKKKKKKTMKDINIKTQRSSKLRDVTGIQ